MRECTKCHRTLPESAFYVKRSTGGLQSHCIDCCKAHGRLRNGTTGKYREENTDISKMINMDKIINYVYETYDYDKFHIMEGNRYIDHDKIIAKSMGEKFLFSPILVNDKMEIIDGQNRFMAAKSLGKPINYIIKKGYGINEVRTLNTNSRNWGMNEFIKSFADCGNKEYEKIVEFHEKYPEFSLSSIIILLNAYGGKIGQKRQNNIKDGKYKVNSIKKSERIAQMLIAYKPFHKDIFKRTTFIGAIIKLSKDPQFNNDEVIRKIKLYPRSFVPCINTQDYINMIEDILNYRKKGVKIRFNV